MLTRQGTQRLRDALERLDARPRPTEACPPGEILLAAVRADLDPQTLHAVGGHAIGCEPCGEGWRMARAIVSGTLPPLTEADAPIAASEAAPRPPVAPVASYGHWGIGLSAVALAAMAAALWIPSAPQRERSGGNGPSARDEPIVSRLAAGVSLARDRCVLRWSGPPGARYRVSVATPDLRPLVESAEIEGESFEVPAGALDRLAPGGWIVWQVTARLPGGDEIASPHFIVPVE